MSGDLSERLAGFSAAYEGKPIDWSRDNCSLWPALWVQDATGLRLDLPQVSGMRGARRWLKGQGGLDAVWDRILGEAGIRRGYGSPELGDVGLIDTRARGTVGAIFAINSAMVRTENGFHYLPLRAVRQFWKVA